VLQAAPDFLRTAIAFIVVLGVLVSVHEYGHYLAARWRGVHVDAFSIGFGRAIATWVDRRGTVWKLAWIPLGGYVKLHGQERAEEVAPEQRARWIAGQTFQEKSVLSRAIVVAAGPAANFLLAAALFAGLFASVGRPHTLPLVTDVMPGSAAAHAGLHPKDDITAIDGTPVGSFEDLQRIIEQHPDAHLTLSVRRGNGERLSVAVLTGSTRQDGRTIGLLGIRGGQVDYRRVGLPQALWGGVTETWRVTAETAHGVAQMITGRRGTAELGGPLRIAELSGEVAALGAASLVSFIAVLSVNLGMINLFPIPVLDGGHLLFYVCEAVRGRPLPARAQEYGIRAGIALLAGLFVFATWNDITHIGWFHRLLG
jgi:regulator of sigma E protease